MLGRAHPWQTSLSRWVSGIVVVALLLLAACAALPPRNPPRVDVVGVALDRIDGPDVYFTVTVSITNVGEDDNVLRDLQGRLSIEGEEVARATLVSPPVRVSAHASSRADLSTHTGMDQLLRAVAAAMRRGATATPNARPALHYAMQGTAVLESGYRLNFGKEGEIGDVAR
jgi:hypothetical protein